MKPGARAKMHTNYELSTGVHKARARAEEKEGPHLGRNPHALISNLDAFLALLENDGDKEALDRECENEDLENGVRERAIGSMGDAPPTRREPSTRAGVRR